jgi:anti-anti-sigma factor
MKPPTSMAVQEHYGVSVVRLGGEIDASSISEVGDSLVDIAAGQGLIIDLSEVTYLNSAMVKLLFDLSEMMRKRQRQLRLVMTEVAPMKRMFQLLKFDLVVPLHSSLEDALQSHVEGTA